MKTEKKRILSLLLALLLLAGLLPTAAYGEDGPEEELIIALEETEESTGEDLVLPQPEEPVPGPDWVELRFVSKPQDLSLLLYPADQLSLDEEERRPLAPGEDGSYLLPPGDYFYSARRYGYVPAPWVPFSLYPGEGPLVIPVLLQSEWEAQAALLQPAGPEYEPARPLPTLTGDRAWDTARIAESQLGYHEQGENGTVYGEWWNTVTDWGVDYSVLPWCAMFACWCAYQAGAGLGLAYDRNGASCELLLTWLKGHALANTDFTREPRVGDFVFFDNGDGGDADHVAVVTDFDSASGIISFVGGNQSDAVTRGQVKWESGGKVGSQLVIGWGRPNYEGGNPQLIADKTVLAVGEEVTLRTAGFKGCLQVVLTFYLNKKIIRTEDVTNLRSYTTSFSQPGTYQISAGGYRDGAWTDSKFVTLQVFALSPRIILESGEVCVGQELRLSAAGTELLGELAYRVQREGETLLVLPADENGGCRLSLEEPGLYSLVLSGSRNGERFESESEALTVLAHSWSDPVWSWAEDLSGAWAEFSCERDPSHTLRLEAQLRREARDGRQLLIATVELDGKSYRDEQALPSGGRGDANGDGLVDGRDLILLRRFLAGTEALSLAPGADYNGDGLVDGRDLILLRRFLAGTPIGQ